MQYSHIVVGGGSSGAVVAARLSDNPTFSVLLVEAGPDYSSDSQIPPQILDANTAVTSGFNWDYTAKTGNQEPAVAENFKRAAGVFAVASNKIAMAKTSLNSLMAGQGITPSFPYPMAKVMGGGSSVNGALAYQLGDADLSHWTKAGGDAWNRAHIGAQFDKVEANLTQSVPGNRLQVSSQSLTNIQASFESACTDMGFTAFSPVTASSPEGVGRVLKNCDGLGRTSSLRSYLNSVRDRPNLTIISDALVDHLEIHPEKLHAESVVVNKAGTTQRFSADHFVLCAGAVNSPAILMRSGVGPESVLRTAGVTPVLKQSAVGVGLQDHPSVTLWAVPNQGVCSQGEDVHQLVLKTRSDPSIENYDLQLYMLGGIETATFPALNDVIGADTAVGISAMLTTPRSRGRVAISTSDSTEAPTIELNLGTNEQDLKALMSGTRLGWSLLNSPKLDRNIERRVMCNQRIIDSDTHLEKLVSTTVRGCWHPVGSLKMGPSSDRSAVVDAMGGVRGLKNVTVADASIMPTIPSGPTNLTCMMIGERIASLFIEGKKRSLHA